MAPSESNGSPPPDPLTPLLVLFFCDLTQQSCKLEGGKVKQAGQMPVFQVSRGVSSQLVRPIKEQEAPALKGH